MQTKVGASFAVRAAVSAFYVLILPERIPVKSLRNSPLCSGLNKATIERGCKVSIMKTPKLLQTGALVTTLAIATTAFGNPQGSENGSSGAVRRDNYLHWWGSESGHLGAFQRDHYLNVWVTGSRIPQKVEVKAVGTNTFSSMSNWSRREIDQTGRVTAEGVLKQDPSVSVILGHGGVR
jgi:hypothetical protein